MDIDIFVELLTSSLPNIKYTIEKGVGYGSTQSINFLDVRVSLHDHNLIETELFYKSTNNHHYLEYDSFHAKHVRDNIPYNFFKKIIVFTSDSEKEKRAIEDMRLWLYASNYPKIVVDKALHNAKLQGAAPNPKNKEQVIPFVTYNCSNYASKGIVKKANLLLQNCPDPSTKNTFHQMKVIQAL